MVKYFHIYEICLLSHVYKVRLPVDFVYLDKLRILYQKAELATNPFLTILSIRV